MLCGYQPFYHPNAKELIFNIINADYDIENNDWKNVSQEAKELLKCLLNKNPEMRPSPSIALEFPWIQQKINLLTNEVEDISLTVQNNLKKNRRKLRKIFENDEIDFKQKIKRKQTEFDL